MEIKRIIDECTERTRAVVRQHKNHIEKYHEKIFVI